MWGEEKGRRKDGKVTVRGNRSVSRTLDVPIVLHIEVVGSGPRQSHRKSLWGNCYLIVFVVLFLFLFFPLLFLLFLLFFVFVLGHKEKLESFLVFVLVSVFKKKKSLDCHKKVKRNKWLFLLLLLLLLFFWKSRHFEFGRETFLAEKSKLFNSRKIYSMKTYSHIYTLTLSPICWLVFLRIRSLSLSPIIFRKVLLYIFFLETHDVFHFFSFAFIFSL